MPLNIADERAKRASKAVSCCHVIVIACSWAAVLSHYHGLMNSCSRAPDPMPLCYRSPTLSYRRGSGNALAFLLHSVYLLVCFHYLPAPSSIPRESIRSLSNSLPVLARAGFANGAPAGANDNFENKGPPQPVTSPRAPEELPRPSLPKRSRKGSQ